MVLKIKIADILIIAVLLVLSALPLFFFFDRSDEDTIIKVTSGSNVVYYSIDENTERLIENNGHTLNIRISDGSVSVVSSDCEDKICIQSGSIRTVGSAIVCLPADIAIEIVSDREAQDAIAG